MQEKGNRANGSRDSDKFHFVRRRSIRSTPGSRTARAHSFLQLGAAQNSSGRCW